MNKLSIGIPSYNRSDQLKEQLNSLLKQDLSLVHEIIVVDNNSEYDVHELLADIIHPLDKVRIITNPVNIKMGTNMLSPFLYCKTEWLWLLSDDDDALGNSIANILSEIEETPDNLGLIKFSIEGENFQEQQRSIANSLEEFIDYYYKDEKIRRGELVFISNCVFNVHNIRSYIGFGFEYSYTYIGFLLPVIFGLQERNVGVLFSEKKIVRYLPPREGRYSLITVGKGISTLSHIKLNLTKTYKQKFYNCFMSITYRSIIKNYILAEKNLRDVRDLKLIYHNIYTFYLTIRERLIIKTFMTIMSVQFLVDIIDYILPIIRPARKKST
jgi:glycosyltransferase involved in cell wall biosynthesis